MYRTPPDDCFWCIHRDDRRLRKYKIKLRNDRRNVLLLDYEDQRQHICLINFYLIIAWIFCTPNYFPGNIYLFKINNKNTRKRCEICSELTIKTPEWRHWRRSGVFIVNFELILHLFLVFLLLTWNKLMLAGFMQLKEIGMRTLSFHFYEGNFERHY